MKIVNITCSDYDLKEGYIYTPYDKRELVYTIHVQSQSSLVVDFFKVSFLDSKSGFKYKLISANSSHQGEVDYFFNFIVDHQSSEKANIDFIELTIFGLPSVTLKKEIKLVGLKNTSKSFNYISGVKAIVESNLLTLRTRMMSPSWGTIRKNILSNGIKMLDKFHSHFSSSYFKVNEYLRQSYDSSYSPLTYSRIILNERPSAVVRYYGSDTTELIETNDIFSSIKNFSTLVDENDLSLYTVILEGYKENKDELDLINSSLPLPLYLKNNSSNENKYETCIITGYNQYDERIVESILLRKDLYTKTQNTFYVIEDIKHSNSNIEISNYVDLNTNHFVINNNYIIPPIVDSDFRTFKPLLRKQTNKEKTYNTINIYNPTNERVIEELKFTIGDENVEIRSIYLTEDMDIVYTYFKDNTTVINYGKLGIDFSKNIYNSITNNNNEFISVSDQNTSTGDWVEVNVKITDWVSKVKDEAFLIQIRNNNNLFYYDVENKSITTNKVINYNQTLSIENINLEINIENDSPYLITLLSSNLKHKVSCSTTDHTIIPYKVETVQGKCDAILFDNYLYTKELTTTKEIIVEDDDEYLSLIFDWKGYSSLSYKIDFNEYFISDTETNLNSETFKYITRDTSYELPIYLKIDVSKLDVEEFKIGTAFNINNGIIGTDTSCKLTVMKGSLKSEFTLHPKQVEDLVDKFEYKVNISTLIGEVLNDY